jgi:DNA polymerase V
MNIDIHSIDASQDLPLPYAEEGIKAGFPSPAQDYMDLSIDLNRELVKPPSSTFYGKVKGDSMVDAQVFDGDILIIDKSLEPTNGDMAVWFVDGEFTLKFIEIRADEVLLVPANKQYAPIRVTKENDFIIWGIVTYVIHKSRKR